ncbi:lysylphosphatidylglycerol synthase transmembrane domain-containing protein [Gemmatimonadota bacterium]
MKMDWRGVLGIGITVFLLWWVLRGVDVGQVLSEIQGANFLLLGLAVAIVTGTYVLRALRWKVLLHPINSGTSFRSRWAAVNIGFMANNLLPARAGEFARAYALARLEPVSIGAAFGSLVVERFLDSLAILGLLFVAMAAPGFPSEPMVGDVSLNGIISVVTLLLGTLLAGMVVLLIFPQPLVRLAERMVRFLPRKIRRLVVDSLEAFLDGLKVLRSPKYLPLAILWSVGLWAWHSLGFLVAFRAFGIDVGYDVALFVNAIIGFSVSVPSSPGFFGTFHMGARVGLGVYGIPAGSTLAFAFGFHLGGFVPVTLVGLYYVWKLGLSLKEVETSESRVEEAVEREHPELSGSHGGGKDPGPAQGGSRVARVGNRNG